MARQLTLAQTLNPSKGGKATTAEERVTVVWRVHGARQSVLIGHFGVVDEGRKSRGIIALDLDGTLIVPKSGRKYPKDAKDWSWLYGGPKGTLIKEKIQSSYTDGYDVCVITNQKYTAANKSPDLHKAMLKGS